MPGDVPPEKVRRIVQAVADGEGNARQVAESMNISYSYAKNLLKHEYDRIGADNFPHLMAIYFRNHLVK